LKLAYGTVALAALLSVASSALPIVVCTLPDGSKFVGDQPPQNCTNAKTVADAAASSDSAQGADSLSEAAAEGRKLLDQKEAARKREDARKDAARVPRDHRGRIKRSSSARERFLLAHGLAHTPPGCQVDHVVPLAKGGPDVPSNMQLLCGEALREKEAAELR
jgi:hypothetical protein